MSGCVQSPEESGVCVRGGGGEGNNIHELVMLRGIMPVLKL